MKKLFLFLFSIAISILSFGQTDVTIEIKTLLGLKKYDKVIERFNKGGDFPAKALYYIGYAYFVKEDDKSCLRLMDLSISKDDKDPAPYLLKGATLNYLGQYDEAIRVFKKVLQLRPNDVEGYSGLGDAFFFSKRVDQAIDAYETAARQRDTLLRPYSMLAQLYSEKGEKDKALEAFYVIRSKTRKTNPDAYKNALYNIGLLESLKGDYTKAEPALLELVREDTKDYHALAKLIQVYYGLRQYDRAAPYRTSLYDAAKKGLLEENMKDKFCFDQFKVNGRQVQAYERYEEGKKDKIYYKHIFFVLNDEGQIDYSIQTEYSPIADKLGKAKYILCSLRNNNHVNYGIAFNDNLDYDALKSAVSDIIEGKRR